MTSGRLLARNTVWNLLGQGAPMLVALVAIPLLIQGLGTERFGVLAVAWMVIGYFSLFDFGMSRALTQLIADRLGAGKSGEIPALVWTALVLMALLGIAGALALALLAPWLVGRVLQIPQPLHAESIQVFHLLAFSLPWVISTAGLRGILEGNQAFGLVNAIRLPMGIFTFLGPLLVLPFSSSLVPVVMLLVAGRLLAWVVHLVFCLRVVPILRGGMTLRRQVVAPLLRFGGWMTVSNVVSPLMVYLDRVLIAALLSISAVAYYVTPYEVVTKLWLIPGALLGVLFPAFAVSFARDRQRMAQLFDRGVRAVFLLLFPITLLLVTLAPEGLMVWLGSEFARQSTPVLQWLAVGVFINSVGQVPFVLLQGAARPDLTGKLHLIELPFYLVALWWLTSSYGIVGAALVWTLRVAVDAVILFAFAHRLLPRGSRVLHRTAAFMIPALAVLGVAVLPQSIAVKGALLVTVLPLFAILGWLRILTPSERDLLQSRLLPVRWRGTPVLPRESLPTGQTLRK